MKLYTPGPVPVPAEVMNAACQPVLHHHSEEFRRILAEAKKYLQTIFDTNGTIALLAGSAMTGIESVSAACIRTGDHVLVLVHGKFGERLEACCKLRGAEVHRLEAPWGEQIEAEQVRTKLQQLNSSCRLRAVWLVHSETSTGVSLDLEGIARVVSEESPDTLLLVDGVTSVAIQELHTDAWKLDAVVTGAQKGLMSPPGVGIIAMSQRFEEVVRGSLSNLYVNDLQRALDVNDRDMMLWTPPVTIIRAVHMAASMIVQKGLQTVWNEHAARGHYVRQQALARGFTVFGLGTSQALVLVMHPRIDEIRRALIDRHGMMVADGQDQASGRMMRIGICGSYTIPDLEELFGAIDEVCTHLGVGA
ncbi:MAG: alanine--glyoxylate aminotransferase family protein [Candidatus Kapabacteria bacterium]|nr:alanine--glyoxylate aminotransferase family protein [Candidatus Kapabacteria bacterium]